MRLRGRLNEVDKSLALGPCAEHLGRRTLLWTVCDEPPMQPYASELKNDREALSGRPGS